jgi:hypothetical protein
MAVPPRSVDVVQYETQGFLRVPGLIPRSDVDALCVHIKDVIARGRGTHIAPPQIQTQHDRDGAVALIKVNRVTETDPLLQALSHSPAIVDVLEQLLGEGVRVFRDLVVVKPPHSAGTFSWHQDSAYWDVEPKALCTAWIALTEVPEEASCLRVVPGSHDRLRTHGLFVRGRPVPMPVVKLLRTLVSYAGTGDNPGAAGGNLALWKAKRLVLANATRFLPDLADLQDFRAMPEEIDERRAVALTARPGDVVFFHSLLLHSTGPNTSAIARYTPLISYMSRDARFTGKGTPSFRPARRAGPGRR